LSGVLVPSLARAGSKSVIISTEPIAIELKKEIDNTCVVSTMAKCMAVQPSFFAAAHENVHKDITTTSVGG
jgi:hypothetical protein